MVDVEIARPTSDLAPFGSCLLNVGDYFQIKLDGSLIKRPKFETWRHFTAFLYWIGLDWIGRVFFRTLADWWTRPEFPNSPTSYGIDCC